MMSLLYCVAVAVCMEYWVFLCVDEEGFFKSCVSLPTVLMRMIYIYKRKARVCFG